jgi:hypothetical protein
MIMEITCERKQMKCHAKFQFHSITKWYEGANWVSIIFSVFILIGTVPLRCNRSCFGVFAPSDV